MAMKNLIVILVLFSSCVKQQIVEPNAHKNGAEIYIYKTIYELLKTVPSNGTKLVSENWVIEGKVIDDGTAAIAIWIDAYNVHSYFPLEKTILVHCKNLMMGNYYKVPIIAYNINDKGSFNGIPILLKDTYFKFSNSNISINPIIVKVEEIKSLNTSLLNRLITIDSIQFKDTTQVTTLAFPSNLSPATNLQLVNCQQQEITLRTSGYSNLQALNIPKGMGNITAIYSTYNSSPQLILRDASELKMNQNRCQ
jgi:hypothetical protein